MIPIKLKCAGTECCQVQVPGLPMAVALHSGLPRPVNGSCPTQWFTQACQWQLPYTVVYPGLSMAVALHSGLPRPVNGSCPTQWFTQACQWQLPYTVVYPGLPMAVALHSGLPCPANGSCPTQWFTQSTSSFHITRPYHPSFFFSSQPQLPTPSLLLHPALGCLFLSDTPHSISPP